MRKNKKINVMILALLMLVLIGCSGNLGNKKKDTESNVNNLKKISVDGLNKMKQTNDVNITIKTAAYMSQKGLEKNEKLVELSFDITNNTKENFGIGAGDFHLVSENVTYEMVGIKENFGDLVRPGKSLKGTGSYAIPKSIEKGKIIYDPVNPQQSDMDKLEWTFTIK